MEWGTALYKLLISICTEVGINSTTSSKLEKVKRWEDVASKLRTYGYAVSSYEVLRKKWYYLVSKFKEIKDSKSRSGSGPTHWEHYSAMEEALGKDPSVTPVKVVTTTVCYPGMEARDSPKNLSSPDHQRAKKKRFSRRHQGGHFGRSESQTPV